MLGVQSETSTRVPAGGTVGQALAAIRSVDLIGVAPRTILPVRDNASFRTNLVLANAVDLPILVHVGLVSADGMPIGSRDVELSPQGATQTNRVAVALGAPTLEAGRLSLSTPTPGGLFAGYVSVIDNVSNDPRAFLAHAAGAPSAPSANLLANPGFDNNLDAWTLNALVSTGPTDPSGRAIWRSGIRVSRMRLSISSRESSSSPRASCSTSRTCSAGRMT